jgi:hypothetical protein
MDAVGIGPTFPECKVAGFGQLTYAPIKSHNVKAGLVSGLFVLDHFKCGLIRINFIKELFKYVQKCD